jgi:hypothetical protein
MEDGGSLVEGFRSASILPDMAKGVSPSRGGGQDARRTAAGTAALQKHSTGEDALATAGKMPALPSKANSNDESRTDTGRH